MVHEERYWFCGSKAAFMSISALSSVFAQTQTNVVYVTKTRRQKRNAVKLIFLFLAPSLRALVLNPLCLSVCFLLFYVFFTLLLRLLLLRFFLFVSILGRQKWWRGRDNEAEKRTSEVSYCSCREPQVQREWNSLEPYYWPFD